MDTALTSVSVGGVPASSEGSSPRLWSVVPAPKIHPPPIESLVTPRSPTSAGTAKVGGASSVAPGPRQHHTELSLSSAQESPRPTLTCTAGGRSRIVKAPTKPGSSSNGEESEGLLEGAGKAVADRTGAGGATSASPEARGSGPITEGEAPRAQPHKDESKSAETTTNRMSPHRQSPPFL